MKCTIEGCVNHTEAITKLCLEHECVVWHMANTQAGVAAPV